MILLRIPQRANIGSCSWFRKCKWNAQVNADSAYNLRNPFTVWGFQLQLRIPRQPILIKYISYYLFKDSKNLFRFPHILLLIPQIFPFSEQFWAIQCFSFCPWNPKQQRRFKKNSNFADSGTKLIIVSCGIRLQFTKSTVWAHNEKSFKKFWMAGDAADCRI